MCNNVAYINEITAVAGLGYFKKVLAERLEPKNLLTDTATVCLEVFYFIALWCRGNILDFESSVSGSIPGGASNNIYLWFSAGFSLGLQPNRLARYQKGVRGPQNIISHKISGLKLFHPGCLNKVYEKSENQIERVKEFSPEMDFFSSSTVMPQRYLTGQDYFLITPLVIFNLLKVSQERKR